MKAEYLEFGIIFANLLDKITTYYGIVQGAYELNPWVSAIYGLFPSFEAFLITLLISSVMLAFLIIRSAYKVLWWLLGIQILIVANNYYWIWRGG